MTTPVEVLDELSPTTPLTAETVPETGARSDRLSQGGLRRGDLHLSAGDLGVGGGDGAGLGGLGVDGRAGLLPKRAEPAPS